MNCGGTNSGVKQNKRPGSIMSEEYNTNSISKSANPPVEVKRLKAELFENDGNFSHPPPPKSNSSNIAGFWKTEKAPYGQPTKQSSSRGGDYKL